MQFNLDFAFHSPDFVINDFYREFCNEAVTASNARREEAEWERDLQARPDLEAVLDTAVIWLSNAIQGDIITLTARHKLGHLNSAPM